MFRTSPIRMLLKMKKVVSILMVFAMLIALFPVTTMSTAAQNNSNSPLEVLEIQPGQAYDLTPAMFSSAVLGTHSSVNITKMPMSQFISLVDDVNGKYDIIYIGNNTAGGNYSKIGAFPATISQPTVGGSTVNGNTGNEYYSGNDITRLKADRIIDYIRSGQMVIFDNAIFSTASLSQTILVNKFLGLTNSAAYPNVFGVDLGRSNGAWLNTISGNFAGEYYTGLDFNTFKGNRIDNTIDFSWGNNSPGITGVGSDNFSVRWTANFIPTIAGLYNFQTTSDDGSRMFVKDVSTGVQTKVVDGWSDHGDQTFSGNHTLIAGRTYQFIIEMYESGGGATAKFSYQLPPTTGTDFSSTLVKYNTTNVIKRPVLSITTLPKVYDGTEASFVINNRILNIGFVATASNGANSMRANLYLDVNGDGIFKADEIVMSQNSIQNATSNDGSYAFNFQRTDDYAGLQPWKIELEELTGKTIVARSYHTGFTAYKGQTVGVRVLQLYPAGSTLALDSLGSMLVREGEYNIQITKMLTNTYDASPTPLNGVYDMVIFGFGDIYPAADLKSPLALQYLKEFIDSKQSVMFTHDTINIASLNSAGWGGKFLTDNFRATIGQDIYNTTDGNAYYEVKPDTSKISYGYTRLHHELVNTGYIPNTILAYRMNKTLMTQYPFVLSESTKGAEAESYLKIAPTHHQYFQLDLEDPDVVPVYTYANTFVVNHGSGAIGTTLETKFNQFDGRNDYYTYTKGNITFSGTGHKAPSGVNEQQMFVNTMIKAARGANHAPQVSISGLADDMRIPTNVTSLQFSFKAIDPDITDEYLNGAVYIDRNNNGIYTDAGELMKPFTVAARDLKNNEDIHLNLNKGTIPQNQTNFGVLVRVWDSKGAIGEKHISLENYNGHTLQITPPSNRDYLLGDNIDLTFKLDPVQNGTARAGYQNIRLVQHYPSQDFTAGSPAYSEVFASVKFLPAPSPATPQTKDLHFVTKNTGVFRFTPVLKYDEYALNTGNNFSGIGAPLTDVTPSFDISVKSATIQVEAKNSKGRAVNGVSVMLKKKNGAAWTSVDTKTTSGTGQMLFANDSTYKLKTNDYQLEIMGIPAGYMMPTPNTQNISLSYNNFEPTITFTLSGDPLGNVSLTDDNGKSVLAKKQLNGTMMAGDKITNAVLSFKSVRAVSALQFTLTDSINGETYATPVLYKKGEPTPVGSITCALNSGLLTVSNPNLLVIGQEYEVKFKITHPNIADTNLLSLTQYSIKENATDTTFDEYASPSALRFVVMNLSGVLLSGQANNLSTITANTTISGATRNLDALVKVTFSTSKPLSDAQFVWSAYAGLPTQTVTQNVSITGYKRPDGVVVNGSGSISGGAGQYEVYLSVRYGGGVPTTLSAYTLKITGLTPNVNEYSQTTSYMYTGLTVPEVKIIIRAPKLN